MTAQWVKYTGSDEQIADIEFACSNQNGVVLKLANGKQSRIFDYDDTGNIASYSFTSYLICQPHPYADMIKIWADTGCPVWVKEGKELVRPFVYETSKPYWNIPGAAYRLTPFED